MTVNPFRPVCAAAAAVLVTAAIAHADGPDDQFLGLPSNGLNVGPPAKMIAIAMHGATTMVFLTSARLIFASAGTQAVQRRHVAALRRTAIAGFDNCAGGPVHA
jgi:hypothetical protein